MNEYILPSAVLYANGISMRFTTYTVAQK